MDDGRSSGGLSCCCCDCDCCCCFVPGGEGDEGDLFTNAPTDGDDDASSLRTPGGDADVVFAVAVVAVVVVALPAGLEASADGDGDGDFLTYIPTAADDDASGLLMPDGGATDDSDGDGGRCKGAPPLCAVVVAVPLRTTHPGDPGTGPPPRGYPLLLEVPAPAIGLPAIAVDDDDDGGDVLLVGLGEVFPRTPGPAPTPTLVLPTPPLPLTAGAAPPDATGGDVLVFAITVFVAGAPYSLFDVAVDAVRGDTADDGDDDFVLKPLAVVVQILFLLSTPTPLL